ncbi:MAG: hypothetical protein Q4G63_11870, partial [Bacteroidia bacterium]|nr:hypothetical protein [Bacteroidia bacterium]
CKYSSFPLVCTFLFTNVASFLTKTPIISLTFSKRFVSVKFTKNNLSNFTYDALPKSLFYLYS